MSTAQKRRKQLTTVSIITETEVIEPTPVERLLKLTDDGYYQCDTRQARISTIRMGSSYKTKLGMAQNSFRLRGATWYEAIPQSIRNEVKIGKFKNK